MPSTPYFEMLIEEIQKAKREKTILENSHDALETQFIEIERYISGDAEQTLSYYCGLDKNAFPPADYFTAIELREVCQHFEEMLETWGAFADIPDEVPIARKYDLLKNLLDDEFTPFTMGRLVFDFCTGYAPDCKLGKYCRCLE